MTEEKPSAVGGTNPPNATQGKGPVTPQEAEPGSVQLLTGPTRAVLGASLARQEPADKPSEPELVLVRVVEDRVLRPFERWTLALALAGGIVGLITVIVFALQFREMQTQTAILRTQAQGAAASAGQQIGAMQAQVDAVTRQMSLEQRAWVNIQFGDYRVAGNEPLSVGVTLINTGKTPARHLSGKAIIEKVPVGKAPHFTYDRYPATDFSIGLLVPNAPVTNFRFQSLRFTPNSQKIEPLAMTGFDIAEIENATAYVAVHGVIEYSDIFDNPHWIKFCTYSGNLDAVKAFVKPCGDHNDAGEGLPRLP